MFSAITHLFFGHLPGRVLFRGAVEYRKGGRNGFVIDEFTVHQCARCGRPFMHEFWKQVGSEIERRKKDRRGPGSIPAAA